MVDAADATPRPRLLELRIHGPVDPWIGLGFDVQAQNESGSPDSLARTRIGTTTLVFDDPSAAPAIAGWCFDSLTITEPIDGLSVVGPAGDPTRPIVHANGATSFDHLVVRTPNVQRTQSALEHRGFDLRRVREAGAADAPIVQSFYRLGEVILEVVGRPGDDGDGPSSFWGLVANVDDIDALGLPSSAVSAPRSAVQRGRRIATVRPEAGLGIAFAFMDDRASTEPS